MGANFSKQANVALNQPQNLTAVCKVFNQLDKDHSGGLSIEEFRVFARVVLEKDLKDLNQAYAVEDSGKMMFEEDFGAIAKNLKGGEIDQYVDHMYKVADIDGDGNMTFDEFRNFLKTHHMNRFDSTGLNDSRGFGKSFDEGTKKMG